MAFRRNGAWLIAPVAALVAGCAPATGQDPSVGAEPRVVEMTVTADARFSPDRIEVRAGETIRFVLTNPTASDHGMFIGSEVEQDEHHNAHGRVTVESQAAVPHFGYGIPLPAYGRGEMEYHFAQAGEILIGCHLPGHYEAGHVATVVVSP